METYTDIDFVSKILPIIDKNSNKGDNGRLLLICGSYSMAGACIMAAEAALRSGIGLLDIALDKSIYPIVAAKIPEAVYTVYNIKNAVETHKILGAAMNRADALVIGCGLGVYADTICPVMGECKIPALIDADALNYISRNPQALNGYRFPKVFTPHPGEMSRLTGKSIADIQQNRIQTTMEFAKYSDSVTLLKGNNTVISDGEKVFINTTGNEGMAKGGSGDALSGITGTFLAQGLNPFNAAIAAAFIHGMAGDIAAETYGARSMLPRDLIKAISEAFMNI